MKYLAVFFLVGLGFASAYTSDFDGALSADRFENADAPLQVGGWITDRMRESLQVMIDGFEKAIEEGKTIPERAFKKAEDLYNKLRDWGLDMGDEIKEAFERIREYFEKNRPSQAELHVGGWITDRMRESLQVMIDGFEKAIEEGRTIPERAFKKAEDLYNKLVDWGLDLGEEMKEAFERIREYFEKNRPSQTEMHVGGWITDRMRESLQVMIDGFEKAMKEGNTIPERAFKKAEELYNKLVNWGLDLGDEMKEAFERIREYFEKNRPSKAELRVGGWITDRMRESLQVMIDGFEKAMKEGKTIPERAFKKAEELYNKLLDWGLDLGEEIKEALERVREYFEQNRPSQAELHVGGWITDRMRESLQVMIDGFEKAIEEGKTIPDRAFKKAEELYNKLKDWGMDLGDEIKEAFERIREYFEKNRPDRADNPMQVGGWISDRIRESLQIMIDSFERAMEEGHTISKKAFEKAEDLYQKLLNWGIDVGDEIKEAFERIREYIEKNA